MEDINSDFWRAHPESILLYDDEFVAMSDSSKIMWSIYLYCDPRAVTALDPDDNARLDHIRKRYNADFDPEDPFIEAQIEIYKLYIPEPEIIYMDLLKQCRDILKFYQDLKLKEGAKSVSLAKDKMDGLAKAQTLLDKLLAKRKELQASRILADKKGLGGYAPSRLESGRIGGGSR